MDTSFAQREMLIESSKDEGNELHSAITDSNRIARSFVTVTSLASPAFTTQATVTISAAQIGTSVLKCLPAGAILC